MQLHVVTYNMKMEQHKHSFKNLNASMVDNGMPKITFKGLMVNNAQDNWNEAKTFYSSGDLTALMEK